MHRFHSVLLVSVVSTPALAESAPSPVPVNPVSVEQSIKQDFDGRVFVANYGQNEKLETGRDVISFENGMMSTKNCIKFGFQPAPYFLRVEGSKTYFYSEMPNQEQGVMKFSGSIENDQLSAKANWQQARWYWTVNVDFLFEGKRANPGDDLTATFKE